MSGHKTRLGARLRTPDVFRQSGRQRDIFPLSRMIRLPSVPTDWPPWRAALLLVFCNALVCVLNDMYNVPVGAPVPQRPLKSHRAVHERIFDSCSDLVRRLDSAEGKAWTTCVMVRPETVGCTPTKGPIPLVADKVDVLEKAGLQDPMRCLPADVQQTLREPKLLFPGVAAGSMRIPDLAAKELREYCKLTCRQLRSGKLLLTSSPAAGGGCFCIGKRDSTKVREIWHGGRVSRACARPPCPRWLASPSALARLVTKPGQPFRLSKRDGRCWFDQLRVPGELQRWFARPCVDPKQLCRWGHMEESELKEYLLEGDTWNPRRVWPCAATWPMGFAWSSYIAQEYLLDVTAEAELGREHVVAMDVETPESFTSVFAAATDDLMILSNGPPGTTKKIAARVDAVFDSRGIFPSRHKEVNDCLSGECVGVQLENGVRLGVGSARVAGLLWSVMQVLAEPTVDRKQLEALLGAMQWYHLLRRPLLAGLNRVYRCLHEAAWSGDRLLQEDVLDEVGSAMLLGSFWTVDLCKPYAPVLGACDASTSFGFGGCIAAFPEDLLPRLARWCEKAGAYAVLDSDVNGGCQRRAGARLDLEIGLADFKDVLSVRIKHKKHINSLECEGLLLWLRWYTRSSRHQNLRLVILIDSTVVACAAAKGRSSSSIGHILRRVAASELATGLVVFPLIIPSAHNPADDPSRGVRQDRGFVPRAPRPSRDYPDSSSSDSDWGDQHAAYGYASRNTSCRCSSG